MIDGTAFNVQTQSGIFTNEGTIEGQFALFFASGATGATVTNRGTIRGGTGGAAITLTNSDDSLTLVTGSTTQGIIDGRGGTDTLTLSGTGTGVLAVDQLRSDGDFRNLEVFNKTDTGTWRFTGDNAAALAWAVAAGRVRVDGDIRNTSFALSGGTLGGNGRVGTVALGSGAAISPGNSVGTLTTGDLTFAAGSVYEVEISGGSADLINVIGTAILSGGTVHLNGGSAGCSAASYQILTATNPITTTFAGITGTSGATLSYGTNSVAIDFAGSGGRTFTGFGVTPNQEATAVALDALGCNGQPYAAALNALTDAEVPDAMDALSGEGHAAIAAVLTENSNHIAGAISDRLEQAFHSVDEVEPNALVAAPACSTQVCSRGFPSGDTAMAASCREVATAMHRRLTVRPWTGVRRRRTDQRGLAAGIDGRARRDVDRRRPYHGNKHRRDNRRLCRRQGSASSRSRPEQPIRDTSSTPAGRSFSPA